MGLENLSSVFSDISQNSLEKVDKANSIVNDKLDNNEFGAYSETPIKDSVFANKSLQLKSGQSLIDDDEHSFGTQNRHNDLIYIDKITKGQIDSPIAKTVSNGTTTLDRKGGDAELDLYGGYSGNVIDPKVRKKELNIEIGKDNRLGVGDFVFDTLYNVNHTAKLDRKLIDTGRTDENGNKIVINTLESTKGQAWSNMDIMSSVETLRGKEPYIVNNIGITKSGGVQEGNNRDLIPFNASKDDISRLNKFYDSQAGSEFRTRQNVTAAAFSSVFTISPTRLWPEYPRAFTLADFSLNQTLNQLKEAAKQAFKGAVSGIVNTSNARLLGNTISFGKALPTPTYGNTGFLNFVNSSYQKLTNPRVGTLVLNYGTLVRSGQEELSKIFQLGVTNDVINQLPMQKLRFRTFTMTGLDEKRNPVSVEVGTVQSKNDAKAENPLLNKKTAKAKQKLPFNNLVYKIPKNRYETDDIIAKSKVVEKKLEFDTKLKPNDFYVRIKDLRDNQFIYFRGFVTGITENANPSFTSTNYIGRSEPVYLYERGDRDLSFNLRLYPNNKDELTSMYEKIDRLTSLAYPKYEDDVNSNSLTRMKAPFTELYMAHIGTRKKGQFGFLKSLSYTVGDSGDWDADTNLPKLIDVAISYQILNKKPPQLNQKGGFYGYQG
tara:strand:- start:10867 stop:12846 length:1980 start_codon:yes stop_codon:yes gene_type:complete